LYLLDVPALELFDRPMAIVGEMELIDINPASKLKRLDKAEAYKAWSNEECATFEAIEVACVVALCLWGELLELLGSFVVGDHCRDTALGRAPRRGAQASNQGGVTSIELGAVWITGQAIVNASVAKVVANATRWVELHLDVLRQAGGHGSLSLA